ncbi:DUF4397 domain-containing protein [Mucilaginibacter sp. SG564]|uniref:DUF4397 domain-containing protein n=1 Tax=Mucilaginibacter sp. SG564 TaxID=2587022 RepID=UPI0015554D4C|nr:DUF4397 domain-containing protein [Mucilaginibacter sp. SG564]NOW96145.1 hypothetical protein [Mucilaginibacter sp. SG564]
MTILSKHFIKVLIAPIFGIIIAASFTACKKNKSDDTPGKSNLSVVDASAGTWQLDFKINGVKYNQAPLKYDTVLPYASVTAGSQTFSISLKNESRVLINASVNLRKDRYYTAFIASLKELPYAPLFVITQEDLTPVNDKARVRFINVGADTKPVNLYVSGTDAALFEQLPFREATLFKTLPAGEHYNFQIKENAQAAAIATLNDVKLENGKLYTVYVKGFKSDNTSIGKLKLSIISSK